MNRVSELAAVLERAGIGPDFDPAELSKLIERARVVAVLDEWADKHKCATPEVTRLIYWSASGQFRVWLNGRVVYGKTRDDARAAAAKAIEAGEV